MKVKVMKEKDMWPLIELCLSKKFKWGYKWQAQCGKPFGRWPAGLGAGQPDVVGVSNIDANPEIHFVEAKLLHPSREKFSQTMAQLRNWRPYADQLWVAFTRDDWKNLEKQQMDECNGEIEGEGFGLLLVSQNYAAIIIEPKKNPRVEQLKQQELLRYLKIADTTVPIFALSYEQSVAAAKAAAWCCSVFHKEARLVAHPDKKKKSFYAEYDKEHPEFGWDGWYDSKETRAITGDPFGMICGDGRPAILVWKKIKDFAELSKTIAIHGAFIYAEDRPEHFKTIPLKDFVPAKWEDEGFDQSVWLIWQIPIENRTRKGLRASIAEIWENIKTK